MSEAPTSSMPDVGAVLLAGGLARRMGGQDKGLVMLAGKPMLSYALRTVLPLVQCCVINANRHMDDYAGIAPEGVGVIADTRVGHLGPLAGLSAALEHLPADYVLMCPCDSPFVQSELLSTLIKQCVAQGADIAAAHDGKRLQPVFCVVHRRVKASLDTFLDSGERKIDRWFGMHHLHEVDARDYAQSFRNINTPEELKAAEIELAL